MTKLETKKFFDKITKSLEDRKLKDAFDLFRSLQNCQIQEQLGILEGTYKLMLQYIIEGINDPAQQKVYNDIVRSLYQIRDEVELQMKTSNDNSLFYEKRRTRQFYVPETSEELISSMDDTFGKIELLNLLDENEKNLEEQKESIGRKIFHTIYLSSPWSSDEKEKWAKVLENQIDTVILPNIILTAITLNLMETFDEKKAIMLFEAAQNSNENIKERAYTGIVLFLRKYNNRLYLYPEITGRLEMLAENPTFTKAIRLTLLQFIQSKETEKITKKIKDELLPEMMKMGPKMGDRMKWDELMSDSNMGDKNPEWQKLIEKSGLQDKLQELTEMQLEGADVMHSSFIHLKNYPYFNELANWFMPFTTPSEAIGKEDLMKFGKILTASALLCNSDKYSFFFSVSLMPESYRKMMMGQFATETDAIKNTMKDELENPLKDITFRTRQYIQDLYRFYKLHPKRKDFEDIFEIPLEFYKIPLINELIKDEESLQIIGEYYFNKNHFQEAADVFTLILATNPENDMLFQKKGYCHQMTGDLQQALDYYLKAELVDANNPWIIKKLAHCYRILKKSEEALFYYKKAEQLNPDNLFLQLNIGHCYLDLKNYDEALKYYFKVEYLDKNKEKAWRAIAWCSFLMEKYEQATSYFGKIIESNPNATDYLNAGHTQLVLGELKQAIIWYDFAIRMPGNSIENFIKTYNADIPDLQNAGVKDDDIRFILETLSYEIF